MSRPRPRGEVGGLARGGFGPDPRGRLGGLVGEGCPGPRGVSRPRPRGSRPTPGVGVQAWGVYPSMY